MKQTSPRKLISAPKVGAGWWCVGGFLMKDETFAGKLEVMRILEQRKIVRELMPEHDGHGGSMWSWEVLMPELIPSSLYWLEANIITNNGIVRL